MRTVRLMILVWIPFITIFAFASPAVSNALGDSYPHIAFHLFAPAVLVTALVLARRLLVQAATKGQRTCLRILMVTLPLAVLGNLVELFAAMRRFVEDGWESVKTPDVFNETGLHMLGANLTIPSLMISMLVALALAAVTAVQRLRRLESVS